MIVCLNLNYRLEAAEKLGFKNFAELSLITKMAPSTEVIEKTLLSILEKGIFMLFCFVYHFIFKIIFILNSLN